MTTQKRQQIVEAFAFACANDDFAVISDTWSQFFHDLVGARGVFVVSDPKHDLPFLPLDTSFEGKCFLKGFLKGRQLGLIQNKGSSVPFNYAPYIFADTNFVSYCNSLLAGKSLGNNANAFYSAGDYLMSKRENLNAFCYLTENYERRHLSQVKDSIKAFISFKLADADAFHRRREICPAISESEIEKAATSILHSLESQDFKILYDRMRQNYLRCQIALTKMATIGLGNSAKKSAKYKFIELVEYFDREVALLPQIELLVAWRFYEFKSQDPFFNPVQRNAIALQNRINSMAWDLAHWRNAAEMVLITGHIEKSVAFQIPYFLTFDNGFARLLEQIQLKGMIFLGGKRVEAIHGIDLLRSFSTMLEGGGERLISQEAILGRKQRLPTDEKFREHLESLAQTSSQELLHVLTPTQTSPSGPNASVNNP